MCVSVCVSVYVEDLFDVFVCDDRAAHYVVGYSRMIWGFKSVVM